MYMYIYKQYIIINTFNSLGTCFEKKASICFGKSPGRNLQKTEIVQHPEAKHFD